MEDPQSVLLLLLHLPQLCTIFLGFSLEAIIILIFIIILLILSGLISGSEIAFFSLNPNLRQEIIASDTKQSKAIMKLLNSPKKLLAGILISNNFINITIILLSNIFYQTVFDFSEVPVIGFVIQVVIVTSIILLFGEIMPKIFAKQSPMIFVKLMVTPLTIVTIIFKPLILLLSSTTNKIDKRLAKRKPQLSMEDLSDAVDLAGELENMKVEDEDQRILKGIATFGDTEVKEIMKARVDVKAVDYKSTFNEIILHIQEWGYSRIPVYQNNLDQIKGVLYIKDLLSFLEKEDFNWQKKIRPAFFVPENKKINDLLQEFREKKVHLAIVVDEYGGTSGIVTMEDVLEEIVGEINDEFDTEQELSQHKKIDENTWIFEAKSSILDFSKIIGVDSEMFEEIRGESDSIAGLILEIKGDFPEINEEITFENIQFKILNMDKRRISQVKIKKI